jgi:hypothetical protein
VEAVNRLKRSLLISAGALCLLALAVLVVLTSTAGLVVTLAILTSVVFVLFRLVLAGSEEGRKTNLGR